MRTRDTELGLYTAIYICMCILVCISTNSKSASTNACVSGGGGIEDFLNLLQFESDLNHGFLIFGRSHDAGFMFTFILVRATQDIEPDLSVRSLQRTVYHCFQK